MRLRIHSQMALELAGKVRIPDIQHSAMGLH